MHTLRYYGPALVKAYYNEIDKYAAAWLRNLIAAGHVAPGDVDERSIADVSVDDVAGYAQCHFFAGIGGWSLALRMAGWPDDRPVWTGSCPCQPFSVAGKRQGYDDVRHLWPEWHRLIREYRPATIFGEQVANAVDWLALVRSCLETLGYAVGCMPIEAASAGANHKRDRLWFVANSDGQRWEQTRHGVTGCNPQTHDGWPSNRLGNSGEALADAVCAGLSPSRPESNGTDRQHSGEVLAAGSWWSVEPDVGRVAHGVPARVGKLRAFGNAIVPQVAVAFIGAFLDTQLKHSFPWRQT